MTTKSRVGSISENKNVTMLEVNGLSKFFPVHAGLVFKQKIGNIKAVDGVSFKIKKGETLGLVGESGCGKTTLGRLILHLETLTRGTIRFEEKDITFPKEKERRALTRQMQMIFQDPFGSLDPRMPVGKIIGQPLKIHKITNGKAEYRQKIDHLLEMVGLNPKMADRYPHEFSGGERQRIGIARAVSLNPKFIVCDEPVSALDVSIQAQIINLLEELQEEFGLTYLFISHDLAVVRHISDRIAVMYLGNIVEVAGRSCLYRHPKHPYTRGLLSAIPIPDPAAEAKRAHFIIQGEVPSLLAPPEGCKFHPRCPQSIPVCCETPPVLRQTSEDGHWVACHNI